jgi:hypothetical protein
MELWHFIWMLAALTGLTAAGLAGNGWAMVTGERPHLWMLAQYSATTPLRAMALMAYAPLGIIRSGLSDIGHNPVFALAVIAVGLLWSFVQGVFILTTFFGFT